MRSLAGLDSILPSETRTRSIRRPVLDLRVNFPWNEDSLDDSARRNLDEIGTALADPRLADRRFEVAGHTDDTGTEEFNLELSERRAVNVKRYLVEHHGIAPERLAVKGLGESQPKETGSSEAARRENRRVEFQLLH